MCLGFGKFYVKPQPPRREKYKNEEKYRRDYQRYEEELEAWNDPENRRRMLANSRAGGTAGLTAAIS
ncbi:hypothetical protein N7478_004861 [Penicillium angulare]|uniref:uncharacterized protein n=1 Tax=Penicillium angulare TaxID=116970 RepID=UPI002541AE44|nr:uncharacterized protein N7478_004861 [Penicillium angulare]KAJ5279489.1 hypothetical protein N7478_004861 [Penicillium angulare]